MSTSVFHRLGQGVEHTCVCEGREGASGNVVGGREPQGILWVGGNVVGGREPFWKCESCVCVCVCVHV